MIATQDGKRFLTAVGKRVVAAIALILVCCFALVAAAESSYTVKVTADGTSEVVKTSERSADAIIDNAGITVGLDDAVDLSNFKVGADSDEGNEIRVLRAQKVNIFDDDELAATVTVAGTVQDALDKSGVELRQHDQINIPVDTELTEATNIKIKRAASIDVTADGVTREVEFVEGTTADVLDRLGITLGENDEVKPALTKELKAGSHVYVYRVTYQERTVEEDIAYETVTRTSSALANGKTKVSVKGKKGTKKVTYKDKVVDGEVASSEVLKETVIKQPINEVVLSGSRISVSATGTISTIPLPSKYTLSGGIPTNAVATLRGSSTAYTATGNRTSTGKVPRPGYVAVDPREIPYGTEMYIVSADGSRVYGYAIAADTGGFIYNSNTLVDLYMSSQSQCVSWGRRNVVIYILSWG